MIASSVLKEIQRLLAEGKWSFREVGRMTGVSHGTVSRVAHGQLPIAIAPEPLDEEEPGALSGPLVRCRGCGGRVEMPCRLCSVRERSAGPSRVSMERATEASDEPLGLDLTAQQQARYEEIRARRADGQRQSHANPSTTRPKGEQ